MILPQWYCNIMIIMLGGSWNFSFPRSSFEGQFKLSSVCPKPYCLPQFKNLGACLSSNDGNPNRWQILLMCWVWSLCQNEWKPENKFAKVWWRKVAQLQAVWLLNYKSFFPEKSHACTQWREAFQLHTVWLFLQDCKPDENTHANAFRGEAFWLHTVWIF